MKKLKKRQEKILQAHHVYVSHKTYNVDHIMTPGDYTTLVNVTHSYGIPLFLPITANWEDALGYWWEHVDEKPLNTLTYLHGIVDTPVTEENRFMLQFSDRLNNQHRASEHIALTGFLTQRVVLKEFAFINDLCERNLIDTFFEPLNSPHALSCGDRTANLFLCNTQHMPDVLYGARNKNKQPTVVFMYLPMLGVYLALPQKWMNWASGLYIHDGIADSLPYQSISRVSLNLGHCNFTVTKKDKMYSELILTQEIFTLLVVSNLWQRLSANCIKRKLPISIQISTAGRGPVSIDINEETIGKYGVSLFEYIADAMKYSQSLMHYPIEERRVYETFQQEGRLWYGTFTHKTNEL